MALFDLFRSKKFEELFEITLEKEMSKQESELLDRMAKRYFALLRLLCIDSFDSFRFPDYKDCRTVVIDGNIYDFDAAFRHKDKKATEALCAIDALIADSDESVETLLKRVEETVNTAVHDKHNSTGD